MIRFLFIFASILAGLVVLQIAVFAQTAPMSPAEVPTTSVVVPQTPQVIQQMPVQPDSHWSPLMVIMVITSAVSAIGGLVTMIISAITKAKLEIYRETSKANGGILTQVHEELKKNTDATAAVCEKVGAPIPKSSVEMPEPAEPSKP